MTCEKCSFAGKAMMVSEEATCPKCGGPMTEAKTGARHSGADMARLQAMHDHSVALGADCPKPEGKSGTRHSKADMADIQAMHDLSAKQGATCESAKSKDLEGAVEKIRTEFYEGFGQNSGSPIAAAGPWVQHVYDDVVIASSGGDLYRVKYKVNGDDVEFAPFTEWEKVEVSYVPAGGSAAAKADVAVGEYLAKLQALYAAEKLKVPETKSANMADFVESRIHAQFTMMADDLFGGGYLNRDERIALSGAIGDALDAFHVAVEANAPNLSERDPYEQAPDDDAEDSPAGKSLDPYAVKFIGENELEGYSMLWGSQDMPDASKHQDFFTPDTDRWADKLPLPRPLTYHHGFNKETKSDPVIGKVTWEQPDEIGLKYRATVRDTDGYGEYVKSLPARKAALLTRYQVEGKSTDGIDWDAWEAEELRKAKAYDQYVKGLMARTRNLVRNGALKTSSDSIPQYVQREPQANGTNWVKVWPHVADALTGQPAEPRMRSVAEVTAAYKTIGVELQLPEASAEAPAKGAVAADAGKLPVGAAQAGNENGKAAGESQAAKSVGKTQPEEQKMTEAEMIALLDKRDQDKAAKEKADAEAKAARDAEVKAEVDRRIIQMQKEAAAKGRPGLFAGSEAADDISVSTKYDAVPLEDLAFLAILRTEGKAINRSRGADELLLRTIAAKSFKAIEAKELEAKAMEDAEFKANEVMQSTLAGSGAEWVFTNYSSQLWLKLRGKSRILANLPQVEVPKGYKSNTYPLESTDFTFYNVSQVASDDPTMKTPVATVTDSKYGTANKEIVMGKLGARGEIAGELDEDSIIGALPEARNKLERQMPEELDFVIFNADDTANPNNINNTGNPTAGADYTLWKGLIQNGLIANTAANAVDFSAAISSANFRKLFNTLGTDGFYVWEDPEACGLFVDYQTYSKVMGLSDLLTVANAGENYATIVRGDRGQRQLFIHGVMCTPSVGVRKAQATGIRHATETNNTLGRAVLVRYDQWKVAWKRRALFETQRIARADVTELVVTMRFGMGSFDTEGSAVGYDI